jgi:hypothetical protein
LAVWTARYEHVLERHHHIGDWEFIHYDQFLDGSAMPRLQALMSPHIDPGFADRGLKRSADSPGVPPKSASRYERLCALALFGPEACRMKPALGSSATATANCGTEPARPRRMAT